MLPAGADIRESKRDAEHRKPARGRGQHVADRRPEGAQREDGAPFGFAAQTAPGMDEGRTGAPARRLRRKMEAMFGRAALA